ncbi:MAG: glycoside hydrolase family 3 C-terminal domain-containing protein [Eubacteriales bacterium]
MKYKNQAHDLVSKMTLAEKISQLRYDAPAIERLGIPAYNWWNECLHGVARSGAATVFPQAIGMAASFDDELMLETGTAISDEARAKYNEYRSFGDTGIYQGLTFWSPNINIFRDPRWGRGHETYGEDPYLTGRMGAAFVRGLQGDDPEYRKTDATLKHYAVHSGPEGERHSFNVSVSKKDLWETYLSAFAYCIKRASPAAVMGAYNRVDGEPCCASPTMIGEILRGQMNFKGYFLSDCGAICDINRNHHVTENEAESAALAVKNGCDLNCGSAYQYLKAAFAAGLLTEDDITVCAERLFEARYRLGMLGETPYDCLSYDKVECAAHTSLNRRMAQESMVLLKNDGILPLSGIKKLAVIGPNADSTEVLLGNYNGTPSRYTTLLRGIQDEAARQNMKVRYARGCHLFDGALHSWAENPTREAVLAARGADAVIMIMGLNPRMEGEEGDAYNGARSGDRITLELPDSQKYLFSEIMKENKPVIFINVSGSCVALTEQDRTCSAVIQCFYPGAEGGSALADILFGTVCPSGRLPVTFYRSDDDLPLFEDYSMANRTYRYFGGQPLYPFGYGLSYTSFGYTDLLTDKTVYNKDEDIILSFTLTNSGSMNGSEITCVYLAPETPQPGVPLKKLVAFKRNCLVSGCSASVAITIENELLMYTNDDGMPVFRNGSYRLAVGDNFVGVKFG